MVVEMKEGVGCRPLRAVNVVVVVVTGQVFRASLTLDNAEGCVVDATPQRSRTPALWSIFRRSPPDSPPDRRLDQRDLEKGVYQVDPVM